MIFGFDEEVNLVDMHIVFAAGADEFRMDLGDHTFGIADHRAREPDAGTEAAVAQGVRGRDGHQVRVGRVAKAGWHLVFAPRTDGHMAGLTGDAGGAIRRRGVGIREAKGVGPLWVGPREERRHVVDSNSLDLASSATLGQPAAKCHRRTGERSRPDDAA